MADKPSPDAAPISPEFYSARIESLKVAMETLDVNNEQAKAEVEIEFSKVHWSELASSYHTAVGGPGMDSSSMSLPQWVHEVGTPEWELEVAEDNLRVFRSLQEKYPGGFFVDENDVGPDSTQRLPKWLLDDDGNPLLMECPFVLSSETPFAEGAQAQLFHAHFIHVDEGGKCETYVMKVFKEGTPLRDLLRLLPPTMLTSDETCIEGSFGDDPQNFNPIGGARLLKSTGRFGFLMWRAWGDVRKLIDERMVDLNTQGPPFPDEVAFFIIYHIAKGMRELHERYIMHRDLKAANVLVFDSSQYVRDDRCSIGNSIDLFTFQYHCRVADFECSVGVVGTGFWRAPEILEAVKKRNIFQKPELFTKQADVYSFGMTCYEILSGGMPFQGVLQANDYDSVIGGARPMLPSQTPPWMVDLVNRCWHKDPSKRPSFREIVEILHPYAQR